MNRCFWCNEKNPIYVDYHDHEWGKPHHDDQDLFELLILETFQAGLSWEIILNKRENFRKAFDQFDINTIMNYDQADIERLRLDPGIIRNRLKIQATITNAKVYRSIQQEWHSFDAYLWHWTNGKIIYETGKTSSDLSDQISKDLKKRRMKFVGTTIIYSYLQACGIINSHEETCFLYHK